MAWTFSGGVRPTYAWVISIMIFFASIIIVKLVSWLSKKVSRNEL